ncbi:MAG: hypothetical protein ACR2HX_15995 [Pyrinomonadaceae bacterium]
MKSNIRFLLIVAAISFVAFFGWSVRGNETPAPKVEWAHAVISSHGDNPAQLNQLGSEGWELVAVRAEEKFTGNFRKMELTYYLKRASPTAK